MQRDGASSEKSAAASALKKMVEESDARGLRVDTPGERERKRGNDKDSAGPFKLFIDILKGTRIIPADTRNNYCLARATDR